MAAKKKTGVSKGAKKAAKKSTASPEKCTKDCSVVMVLTIQRQKEWPKNPKAKSKDAREGGTIAKFDLKVNGKVKVKGYMLEAAGASSTVAGSDQRVRAGTYRLIKNPGTKGPYRFVNGPFGNRSAINIHGGNRPTHLEGCFVPGTSHSEAGKKGEKYPMVSASQKKLKELQKEIDKHDEYKAKGTSKDGKYSYGRKYISNLTVIVKEIAKKKPPPLPTPRPKRP